MTNHVFTGFGFGPIQSALFVSEAFQSSNFARIIVAEIDQNLVDAVRANNGSYVVNIAKADGIEVIKIDGIELFNPTIPAERAALVQALNQSTEIVTSLPSVAFYTAGNANSPAQLIYEGLKNSTAPATIIYTAENNNHAAEILTEKVNALAAEPIKHPTRYLNTVIGKMSQVATDPAEIAQLNLTPIAPGIDRAFLVEQFNRIYVTGANLPDFKPGIEVFIEKDDLIPFEEAKLYGHNAIHALIAYLGQAKGYDKMAAAAADPAIKQIAKDAFMNESGAALIKKYAHLGDNLFTTKGYAAYAEDLLPRMANRFLADPTERGGRDPVRKLGYNDRIFGTMALALDFGIEPNNMATGALAGITTLLKQAEDNNLPQDLRLDDWRKLDNEKIEKILKWLWDGQAGEHAKKLIEYTQLALPKLKALTKT